jgi:hypothetical protein
MRRIVNSESPAPAGPLATASRRGDLWRMNSEKFKKGEALMKLSALKSIFSPTSGHCCLHHTTVSKFNIPRPTDNGTNIGVQWKHERLLTIPVK